MSLEALIRRRLVTEGHRQIVLNRMPDGRWQASVLRPNAAAYGVEIQADPVDALHNVLCDLRDRIVPPPADEDLIG